MAIQAIVFDVGGVLELVEDRAVFRGKWQQRLGMTDSELAAALASVDPDGVVVTGGMTEPQYRARYVSALDLTPIQAREFMADLWDWYCGELDSELTAFAASLRPRLVTAILSNSADGARREEMARYAFDQAFDPIIYSHEVGLAKPDPAVFELTCVRIGVAPADVILIDDHAENVNVARSLGMHAIRHVSTPDTIAAVNSLISR